MSQYQSLELNLNIDNNPTNFKEQHNICEIIIIYFNLVHKHLDTTPQYHHGDYILHIMNRKETRRK